MGQVVRLVIAGQESQVKVREYQGQRVVTLRQIDELHRRPAETAARNFGANRRRFIEGTDFFHLPYEELKSTDFVELPSPNGLTVITESGYLMLCKSLTDDYAWEVQRELVKTYFRVKEEPAPQVQTTGDALVMMAQAFRESERRLALVEGRQQAVESAQEQQTSQLTTLGHRLTNLDLANIDGTPRQRLVKMVQRYAYQEGIAYPGAWRAFDAAFNTAYRTNLTARRQNHAASKGKKRTDRPEYLEAVGQIEDAIRVADKMLNAPGGRQLASV